MEKKPEAGSEARTENGKGKENKATHMEHGTEGAKMEMHHHVHHHHHEGSHHEHTHHHGGDGEAKKVKPSMGERMYDKKKGDRAPLLANEGE
jgi:hypothetical protein